MLAAVANARKGLTLCYRPGPTRGRLLADDGNLGVRNFQPHEAVIAIEQEKNLEVRGVDSQAFVGLAVGTGGPGRLHVDRTRGQILGNDNRESFMPTLHQAFEPLVTAGWVEMLVVR